MALIPFQMASSEVSVRPLVHPAWAMFSTDGDMFSSALNLLPVARVFGLLV